MLVKGLLVALYDQNQTYEHICLNYSATNMSLIQDKQYVLTLDMSTCLAVLILAEIRASVH